MIARIISNKWLYLDNITVWEEELVADHFSAENPNTRYIDSSVYQSWDGVYRKYNRKHKRLARPFLAALRAFCGKNDLVLAVKDERGPSVHRPISKDLITEDFLPGITLKPFQVDAAKTLCSTECGLVAVTTGGGKTEIMAAMCKAMDCPTVIIAEAVVVIDQIRVRLKLRDVCEEPGLFYAGKMPSGETIIVGSIQSLVTPKKKPDKPTLDKYEDTKASTAKQKYKLAIKRYESSIKAYRSRTKKAKALHALIGKCEMIMVDECDLATSKTYQNLFRHWFKGRRRYGFTATPYDDFKPVQKLVLTEHLGSVIYEQKREQVESTGLIVPLEYFAMVFGEDGNRKNSMAYDIAVDEFMIYNEQYHRLIKAVCDKFPDEGKLILVDRHDLGHALTALIPGSQFLYGETPKKKRREMLDNFEARRQNVLIGGKNVRRGLDLSGGCENLILATGGKLASEFEQRIGRARRLNVNGRAKVFDFFFLCNKYLYSHSRNRLKAAVGMEIPSKVVFRDGVVDGAKFVKSRFHKPIRF